MNSAGYSEFDEPIKAREKCYSPARLRLILDIANYGSQSELAKMDFGYFGKFMLIIVSKPSYDNGRSMIHYYTKTL